MGEQDDKMLKPHGPWVWLPAKSAGTDYYVWTSQYTLPNLAEYDPIVVVSPDSYTEVVRENTLAFQKQLDSIFRAGRTMVWILGSNKHLGHYRKAIGTGYFYSHSWWPGDNKILEVEEGRQMSHGTLPLEGLEHYIQKITTWSLVIEKLTFSFLMKGNFRPFLKAVDERVLGAEVRIHSGRMIVLPPIPNLSYEAMVEVLLREVYKILPKKLPPPTWAQEDSLFLPGEATQRQKVDNLTHQIKTLETERTQGQDDLDVLDDYRRILYETGPNLVEGVCVVLERMGIPAADKERQGRQDLEIQTSLGEIYAEVKGVKGNATEAMLRQLNQRVDDARLLEKKTVKGLHILNHQREQAPGQRGNPYSRSVLEFASKRDFCLLTGQELFKGLQKFMQGDLRTADIEKALYEIVGECTFE